MAAPRDGVELAILQIFRMVTQSPTADVDSNFFDLSGSSLQCIVIASRLSRHFGFTIAPSMVYKAQTPKRLAEVVRDNGTSVTSATIPLHGPDTPRSDLAPIVIMPGIGGGITYAHGLASWVGGREVYGLQGALQPKAVSDPDWTFERIASYYCGRLKDELPQRPIVLVGYSVGCVLALEIALQMSVEERNPCCRLVFVAPPAYKTDTRFTIESVLESMMITAFSMDVDHDAAALKARQMIESRTPEEIIGILGDEHIRHGWAPREEAEKMVTQKIAQILANFEAFGRYRPVLKVDSEVLLVLSSEEPEDPLSGTPLEVALPNWRSVRVGGPHGSIFAEPWVQEVGAAIGGI